MGKGDRVLRVVEQWCGGRPERGSDKLRSLWERHGPSGVPFDDEGAERLVRGLDREFPGLRLRPVDVLDLSLDGLIDAVPDRLVTVASLSAATTAGSPVTVELTDETIERLAARIAALVRPKPTARRKKKAKKPSAPPSKSGRRKER